MEGNIRVRRMGPIAARYRYSARNTSIGSIRDANRAGK